MGRLLLLFAVLPFVELYVLVRIGQRIGFLPTLAGILVVGAVGAALARHEGMRVVRAWQDAFREGRVPEEGVLSGLLVFVGGLLLIMPGVISDVLGLLLLIPPTRRLVASLLRRSLERGVASGSIRVVDFRSGPIPPHGAWPDAELGGSGGGGRSPMGRRDADDVIDVEGEEIRPSPPRLR